MITSAILTLIFASVTGLLVLLFSVLPDFSFLSGIGSFMTPAFVWFFGVLAAIDPIIPYSVTINCLNIVVTYYVVLFSYRLISWILRKIPSLSLS